MGVCVWMGGQVCVCVCVCVLLLQTETNGHPQVLNEVFVVVVFCLSLVIIYCALSSLLLGLFSSCRERGLLCSWSVQASHCRGFSWLSTGSRVRKGFSSCGPWAQ